MTPGPLACTSSNNLFSLSFTKLVEADMSESTAEPGTITPLDIGSQTWSSLSIRAFQRVADLKTKFRLVVSRLTLGKHKLKLVLRGVNLNNSSIDTGMWHFSTLKSSINVCITNRLCKESNFSSENNSLVCSRQKFLGAIC